MKATTQTPNTLFIALWKEKGKAVTLGNFRAADALTPVVDEWGPIVQDRGDDSVELLAATLNDVERLKARHVVIFTNDQALADLYTFPVRLEPTREDRSHLYVPAQWDIIRSFCLYESWQCKYAEKLPKAKELWEETHDCSN